MNIKFYSDAEIADLRSIPKKVTNPGARWLEKPKANPVHKQRTYQVTCQEGKLLFSIYLRQNLSNDHDFSCGISYLPAIGSSLTLARYNGSSHIHGEIFYRPHIHSATKKAILAGKKPESEAEVTDCYETIEGALACLVEDFHIRGIKTRYDEQRLF